MNNNQNDNNIRLYNSVFNNCYLRRLIFYHLNIFNILNVNIEFRTMDEWKNFKYKDYLNNITLLINIDINKLPNNIKIINMHINNIKYTSDDRLNRFDSVSVSSVSALDLPALELVKLKSPSPFNKLIIESSIDSNSKVPQSFKKVIINTSYGIDLSRYLLPNNIQHLEISNGSVVSFKENCFPASLTSVSRLRANPSIINQFSSNGLVKLNFNSRGYNIGDNIKFPNTLLELSINCPTFKAKLPMNLKSLELLMIRFEHEVLFPSSLEHLKFTFDINDSKIPLFQDKTKVPSNLRSLEFTCSSLVTKDCGEPFLPDKLERLVIIESMENLNYRFNQNIKSNHLPKSLTFLSLGMFYDKEIKTNILPAALNSLDLGHSYSKNINPLSIPKTLKLLSISNPFYTHFINLTPTHPFTVIKTFNNINSYYQESNRDIRVLRLPDSFNLPLSTLQLQNKSNIEYLHLGIDFNQEIKLSELPINNNIKTLELGNYNKTINLNYFQNLETIIVNSNFYICNIVTTLTSTPSSLSTLQSNNLSYNYFSLKSIVLHSKNYQMYLKRLDPSFYQFIKSK